MITINQADCQGCGDCVEVCPQDAIRLTAGYAQINQTRCDGCGLCIDACHDGAIIRTDLVLAHPAEIIPAAPARTARPGALAAVGSIVTYIGSEILPWALPLALDALDRRTTSQPGSSRNSPAREAGRRYGNRRGGSRQGRRAASVTSGGACICPNCGYRVGHQAGMPCRSMNCPQCGSCLVRR